MEIVARLVLIVLVKTRTGERDAYGVRPRGPAVLDPYEERWVARGAVDEESLGSGGFGVFSVVVGVGFGGFDGVMSGVVKMADGDLRMMRGTVMVAGFVVTRSFTVMARGVFVMFGGFVVMLCGLLGHFVLLA